MIDGALYLERPLRWGVVGGGREAMIGYIHRCSATRDRGMQLLAGALDIDPRRGAEFGECLGMAPDRLYPDYKTLIAEEAKRPDGIEVLSIMTPNHTHAAILKAALEANLHAVCEKPLCFTHREARELVELAEAGNRIVGVTYGYTGHQLLRQSREMVRRGDIGDVRVIDVQFAHGGNTFAEGDDQLWRFQPDKGGPSFIVADVGTHAEFLAKAVVPGLKIKRLLCSMQTFIPTRAPLEDNAFILAEYENGIHVNYWFSGINAGSDKGHVIRVVGSKASLEWTADRPNELRYEPQGSPLTTMLRGYDYLYHEARVDDRITASHQEGLFESWANLYRRFALAMDARNRGDEATLRDLWYPSLRDGAEGVKFVEMCLKSAAADSAWITVDDV